MEPMYLAIQQKETGKQIKKLLRDACKRIADILEGKEYRPWIAEN